ncbi:type II secretion system secretin GspD [Aquabacterium sp. CECT 9606]|uniref:type II secretion system secretin GspD n=1 Tax=Aquabacterium sp. CECT 9606 TaxID=2845822 RepID=UPI001E5668B8|nr:type II secretion system secretin GspD [Aquabacterium sp. CECT 9606]CAH0351422.1 Secretin XcpQ [Aquabacterium sp. CECT 9606]
MTTHPLLSRPRAVALATALAFTFGPGCLMPSALAGAAQAAPVKKGGPTVTLNFVNAEIEGVARAMAAIVDQQILVDPRVKGTITLYSEQPLTPREAYLNFLAALRGQGFAMVEVAGLLKVVPEADAKLQTGTVEVGSAVKRSGDQILTQIFRLQYENVNSLVTVLRPLISPNNTINANPGTNTLVITDYADNLKRIGQMIAAMDVPSSTDMEAMPLQYAIASDLAPMVQRMADGGGGASVPGVGGGQATIVMADPRTNTLMVRAPNPARLALVRTLIQRLDRPGTAGLGGSGIHVIYLKNADAVKLAQVLRASFPGAGGSSGGGSSSSSSGSSASASPIPTAPSSQNSSSSGTASTQSTTPVAGSAQPSTGGFIQADPSTNSLIITATDALYRQLRAVIDQLDGRRAQIYIESMIVKVDAEKAAQMGVQWAGATGTKNIVGAGTNLPTTSSPGLVSLLGSDGISSLASGLNIGFARALGNGRYNLAALATFLETELGGNVLSTPNMVALDNEEAKIVVGENVPFVTGSYSNATTSSSGTVNPFQTIDRKDVGLTLRVRPQVGEGGTVRMTVFQEDSSVKSTSGTSGPTTAKSSIETTVVVDDGQVLVLGGLIKDEYSDNASKVPLLGDIPYLGNLFKSQERTRKKTNLMVFLRPIVMRTQEAANAFTLDRYDYMRNKQIESTPPQSSLMRINEVPVLDPLKLSNNLTMPSVRQPLDDANAPAPTVVMPAESGFAPKLSPAKPAASGVEN